MDFFYLTSLLLFCQVVIFYILLHTLFLRESFLKLLLILELLFLIIIFGFVLIKGLLYAVAGHIIMAIFIIAIAACEAVLGLSLIIIRTRISTTAFSFSQSFKYYQTITKKWLQLK